MKKHHPGLTALFFLLALAPIRQDLFAQEGQAGLRWPVPRMQEVETCLETWARAWSSKSSTAYLSFYSDKFVLPSGVSRSAWETERRESISKPDYIRITLKDVDVELLDTGTARARFTQIYRASNFSNQSRRIVLFKRLDNAWKILVEQDAPDPDHPRFPELFPEPARNTQKYHQSESTTSRAPEMVRRRTR